MRKIYYFCLILSLAPAQEQTFDHGAFNDLLGVYVTNGRVDYPNFKKDQTRLETYLAYLQQVNASEFEAWPVSEKKAYWINAYNALTIKAILDHYPIKPGGFIARARFPRNSIRQIADVWDIPMLRLAGKMRTLNDIEHEILRKRYHDPRLHFVLVCASIGCPLLENKAFRADDLEERLDQATRNFLNNPDKLRIDVSSNTLYLSPIFDWFGEDFQSTVSDGPALTNYKGDDKGVIRFVLKYTSTETTDSITRQHPKIEYLDYDWSLNEQ